MITYLLFFIALMLGIIAWVLVGITNALWHMNSSLRIIAMNTAKPAHATQEKDNE